MEKATFTLTATNPTAVIGNNIESGQAISLRYAFSLGKGMDQQNGATITFRPSSNNTNNFMSAMTVYPNYQNQMDGDYFNYPLYEGQEIIVEAVGLQQGSIYVEVEYVIMDM